jgi:hypothetical protein
MSNSIYTPVFHADFRRISYVVAEAGPAAASAEAGAEAGFLCKTSTYPLGMKDNKRDLIIIINHADFHDRFFFRSGHLRGQLRCIYMIHNITHTHTKLL